MAVADVKKLKRFQKRKHARKKNVHTREHKAKNQMLQKSYHSQTRGINDDCAYKQRLHESTSPLTYVINPEAYESCSKCHMAYPGFIGALGGKGFGLGPDRVDIDSDLRGQTRLQSKCASHLYNPLANKNCSGCQNYDQGLPCGCRQCQSRDVSNLKDCRPGIIPVESLDTRSFNACNPTRAPYINRFETLCKNPQDPARIFFYPGNRRLGAETRLDMRDYCGANASDCAKINLPNTRDCKFGGGCRYLDDMNKGVYQ